MLLMFLLSHQLPLLLLLLPHHVGCRPMDEYLSKRIATTKGLPQNIPFD
jgi:hypothetical protein